SLRDAVLASGFRAATKAAVEELLTSDDSKTAQFTTDAFAKIQGSEEAFTRKTGQLAGLTPALRFKGTSDAVEGNVEQFLQGDEKLREAAARRVLFGVDGKPGALKATRSFEEGVIDFGDTRAQLNFDLNRERMGPENAAIAILQQQQERITNPKNLAGVPQRFGPLSDEDQRRVDFLQQQIDELKNLRDSFGADPQADKANELLGEIRDGVNRNAGGNFGRNVNAQAGRHAE
ncbi:MAG: hypothetical protein KDA41_06265, partial [Planctomycetales bacterium]|nr:hypothetical protein [Planctomycetales bacterium]